MQNRLKGARGYLCGPMDRAIDGGVEWRVKVKEITQELDIRWFDPCDKPIDGYDETGLREKIKKLKAKGDYDEVARLVHRIRCVDLRMVDLCDFMIAKVDVDTDEVYQRMCEAVLEGRLKDAMDCSLDLVSGCGTYEELSWANRGKKPIIAWCPAGKEHIPNWLFGMFPHQMMMCDMDAVVRYLWHVATDENIDSFKRWFFFRL